MRKDNDEVIEAQKGQEKLRIYADDWSSAVGTLGVNATYAIIAANWAVHTKTNAILGNTYATLSIAICILALALYLLLTEAMTEWLRQRWRKAEMNQQWWLEEYQHRAGTRWPYSDGIECLAQWLRYVKALAPVVAGIFFLMSLT